MELKVNLLTATAKLPERAHNTDSGADLFSLNRRRWLGLVG